jgi:hypothetical protein
MLTPQAFFERSVPEKIGRMVLIIQKEEGMFVKISALHASPLF